jgi:hypothetical protein
MIRFAPESCSSGSPVDPVRVFETGNRPLSQRCTMKPSRASRIPSLAKRASCLGASVCFVVSACGDTDERVARPPIANVQEVIRTLSEDQTAGPLNGPTSLVANNAGLWILDAGNQRVLLLRDGVDPVVAGREGAGPGEFKNPSDLHALSPNRVFVWDRALLRSTVLTSEGRAAETQLVPASIQGLGIKNAIPAPRGMLAVFDKSADALNPPSGSEGSQGVLVRLSDGSDRPDTLTTFPLSGPVVVRESSPNGGFTMHAFTPPFDAAPHSDATPACGGLSAVSVGGRGFEIRFFGSDGRKLGILRQEIVGKPITDEEKALYLAQFTGETRRRVEQVVDIPERHPAIHAVRLTSSGHLWVRLTPPALSEDEEPATWRVWSVEQVETSTIQLSEPVDVQLSPRFSVQDVRGGELWGFEYDEMDVPQIRAYRLPDEIEAGCLTEKATRGRRYASGAAATFLPRD